MAADLKSDKAARVALGGVFSSICLTLMFLSSVMPFSSFAMPMLAGLALIAVVIENGDKTALIVYVSVSLLSLFIVPDLDAKLMFIMFFGYYPIIRPRIQKIKSGLPRFGLKLFVFNAAMICGYYFSLKLFGLEHLLEDNELLGTYGPPVFLAALNLTFIIYDSFLSTAEILYIKTLRSKIIRK